MERFAWQTARSVPEAAGLARQIVAEAMLDDAALSSGTILKAGGIDLLDLMKEHLLRPNRLVNLREIPGLATIAADGDGLRIGALATLEQVAAHPVVGARYAALAQAAGVSASPQIRHTATIGGNLLQRPRCWYFRSESFHCARRGGDHCFALSGENRYHAVFGVDNCAIVHPSTAATALTAFGARLELTDAKGATRVVALGDFLIGPEVDVTRENDLRAGEVLTAILLPPPSGASVHLKYAEKASFDWPIADVALVLTLAADRTCQKAAIVLGAAAPVPWRATKAEAALTGKPITEATARAAGDAAVLGAEPLHHNAYKLPIFATLVRRAVLQAAG